MDAPDEDQDIQVQRASADVLADLQTSLAPFLWKKTASGKTQVRRRVRVKETDRLVALLEPFQELPQLLDPHLDKLIPILTDAFLAFLRSRRPSAKTRAQLLMPLSRAICRLLYTFCKIRGEKVIVRFFSTETRHLELLLSAIEAGDQQEEEDTKSESWEWEERYITLLWLSQLLLAPFDLSTISSVAAKTAEPEIPGFVWPANVPGVTFRVIPFAIRFLSSSGKERDAAKILLVRVAMRKDMQEIGILKALVTWSTSRLQPTSEEHSSYHYIGILSFLAGIFNSSISTADMDPYLSTIFQILQADTFMGIIQSSVVARKTSIKVLRNICMRVLRLSTSSAEMVEIVENTIGVMFESLADSATPVRLAASKALSLITLKLAPEMGAQVVEEVLASLKRSVLSVQGPHGMIQDLSSVNPSEWHGLILTLSQLLYRRSPPPTSLSHILPALLTGLSFEQRSTSGSSIGTNVRDAACFGIWALARRYSTIELQAIDTKSFQSNKTYGDSSTIQILATELVVSASVDPAGNIRRGSSAALQELIGRHPNTIAEGIPLVQVVDYHAVALRSRAITEVAFQASQLSSFYKTGILEALLGWRGIGDGDASARRTTSAAFGNIICSETVEQDSIGGLEAKLRDLKPRQDDERHGLILCVASVLEHFKQDITNSDISVLRSIIRFILEDAEASHRRPDLIAEAVSQLILVAASFASLPSTRDSADGLLLDENIISGTNKLFAKWLRRNETEVIDTTSDAASALLLLLSFAGQQDVIAEWIDIIREAQGGGRSGQDKGVLAAALKAFPIAGPLQSQTIEAVHKRWSSGHDIETRAAILKYLTTNDALQTHQDDFVDLIWEGLDDYTTNARGDVGSLVRIEAIKAAGAMWRHSSSHLMQSESFTRLFGKGLRLAAEKLDKVRAEAQQAVAAVLSSDKFRVLLTSSQDYFRFILDMQTTECLVYGITYQTQWGLEMFEGYVGSADTGSEDLVRASRAALASYCEDGHLDLVCGTLFDALKKNTANDRIIVPALEVISFLFDVQIFQRSSTNFRSLYLLVQKAHYKTGNIRKLEAAIRVYGGLVEVYPQALEKLVNMLLHPFPKVRNQVADTLFAAKGVGKGINWLQAGKSDLVTLKQELGIAVSI